MMMNTATVTESIPVVIDHDGVMRILHSRVTLDTLVSAFQDGATAEEIAQQYPTVSLADIYSIIGYYLRRRPEIDAYLARRQQAAQQVRQQNEMRLNPVGIRARLLARRAARTA